MAKLKTEGKEKTVTYRQLFANTLQLQAILSYYQTYGLLENEESQMTLKRSSIKDIEVKHLLNHTLADGVDDREVYMKNIDQSYYYVGYTTFKAKEL